jgi:EAL domain-containing protein (putative c-di-GMP-specific phosphodiesterase class I)
MERQVAAILEDTGAPGDRVTLELTESSIMESPEAAIRTLRSLKKLGIGIAIDDFGTGYSSLSYLHRFPADGVKIDRSFVQPLGKEDKEEGIVRGILGLANDLDLATIAEGVENEVQLRTLRKLGCREVQGFYFSEPVPGPEATRMLEDPHRWASRLSDRPDNP